MPDGVQLTGSCRIPHQRQPLQKAVSTIHVAHVFETVQISGCSLPQMGGHEGRYVKKRVRYTML